MSARYSKLPSEEVELSGRIKSSASSDSSMEGDRFIGPSGIDYSSAFTYDRMKTNRKYFTYARPLPSESLNDLTQGFGYKKFTVLRIFFVKLSTVSLYLCKI